VFTCRFLGLHKNLFTIRLV